MANRIYAVKSGDVTTLVKATSKSAAIAHVVANAFSVTVPTQEELFNYGQEGMKIVDATAAPKAEPVAA